MTLEEPIDDPFQLLWRLLGNVIDSAQYRLKVLLVPILTRLTSSMASVFSMICPRWFVKQLPHSTALKLLVTIGLRSVSSVIIQSDIYVNCSIEARGGASRLQKKTPFTFVTTKPSYDA